ncbi:MAG: GntR family transcriptional regulator [Phycisphaeraceae bacterium]|nr:GntR family transcriptional regulator [Phycisphaeraceae bacterium]
MTAYDRVAQSLRERILDGQWSPGDQLPTERQLCELYDASRITIRRALDILAMENLVERRQGAGTFVRSPAERKIPIVNSNFIGSISRHAPDLKRKLVTRKQMGMTLDVARMLDRCPGDLALFVLRADASHQGIVALDEIWIPAGLADRLIDTDLELMDLLPRWQEAQGMALQRCVQTVEAVRAAQPQARMLGCRAGGPLLRETCLFYLPGDRPAGIVVSYYNPDVFRFVVRSPMNMPDRNPSP